MTAPPVRVAGAFGLLPNDPSKPRIKLGDFTPVSAAPPSADWFSRIPAWPMYLNNQIGDCTCACTGHMIEQASAYAGTEIEVADADVLAEYERVSGYDPATGANDNGATIQDVLGDWRTAGVAGHNCLAFAEVDVTNLTHVKQAIATFAAVDVGMDVYQGDVAAFNSGQPWDVNYGEGGLAGGHCVPVVGYDAAGGWMVTWGTVQRFTWNWWNVRVQEAWAVILPEWLATSGDSPSGYDLYGLGQALASFTGTPNPFPSPGPVDPDPALWAAAGPWAALPRTRPDLVKLQAALKTWAAAKGFQ